jgi:phage tail sheath protein FI
MSEIYKIPNIYVEETSTSPVSVPTVSTAIPAFIGYTEKAQDGKKNLINKPTLITSLLNYEKLFGKAEGTNFFVITDEEGILVNKEPTSIMYYSLKLYYENGGGNCYIVSVGTYSNSKTREKQDFVLGLESLENEEEPTLILLVDGTTLPQISYYSLCQSALVQCNKLKNRFAIFDIVEDDPFEYSQETIDNFRLEIGNGNLNYGAAYYPYLKTSANYYYTDDSVIVSCQQSYFEYRSQGLLLTYIGSSLDEASVEISKDSSNTIDFDISKDKILSIKINEETTVEQIISSWNNWLRNDHAEDLKEKGKSFNIQSNVNTTKLHDIPYTAFFKLDGFCQGLDITYSGKITDCPRVEISYGQELQVEEIITTTSVLSIKIPPEGGNVDDIIKELGANSKFGISKHDNYSNNTISITKEDVFSEGEKFDTMNYGLWFISDKPGSITFEKVRDSYFLVPHRDEQDYFDFDFDPSSDDEESTIHLEIHINDTTNKKSQVKNLTEINPSNKDNKTGEDIVFVNVKAEEFDDVVFVNVKAEEFDDVLELPPSEISTHTLVSSDIRIIKEYNLRFIYKNSTGEMNETVKLIIQKNTENQVEFETSPTILTVKIKSTDSTFAQDVLEQWAEFNERGNFSLYPETVSSVPGHSIIELLQEEYLDFSEEGGQSFNSELNIESLKITYTPEKEDEQEPKIQIVQNQDNNVDFFLEENILTVKIKSEDSTSPKEICDAWSNEVEHYDDSFVIEEGNLNALEQTFLDSFFQLSIEDLKINYVGDIEDQPKVEIVTSINEDIRDDEKIVFETNGLSLKIKLTEENDEQTITAGNIVEKWSETRDHTNEDFDIKLNGNEDTIVLDDKGQINDDLVLSKTLLKSYRILRNSIIISKKGKKDEHSKVTIIKGEDENIKFNILDALLEIIIKKDSETTVGEVLRMWNSKANKGNFDILQDGDGSVDVFPLESQNLTETPLYYYNYVDTNLYNKIKKEIKKEKVVVPPSSIVAGIYAKVDRERGVWKSPANVTLKSVLGPTVKINNELQEYLNVHETGKSINAIRSFPGRGTLIWGARTLAGDDEEWRYISVRRLFIYIEQYLKTSTNFAVFEHNNNITWLKVKSISNFFLERLWQKGAMVGNSPEEAFFVNIGLNSTMTQKDILEGRMIIEVGIAPVKPAEFIILKFSHKLQEA